MSHNKEKQPPAGEIILFQPPEGDGEIRVLLEGETVWLTHRTHRSGEHSPTLKRGATEHGPHKLEGDQGLEAGRLNGQELPGCR